jgi:hypothetical protein
VSRDLPLAKEFVVIMEVRPEGDASRFTVTLRGEPKGPLGGLVGRMMRPGIVRDNRRTVEAFAELARARR